MGLIKNKKNKTTNNKSEKSLEKFTIDHKSKKIRNKFMTGVCGFDKLLKEGVPRGNSIIIEGGPGSGKTIFCLSLLREACKRGERVLYMSFEEPEENLKQHMEDFGFDATKYEKDGLLMIRRFSALDIARSVEALLSEAKKELLIDLQPVLIPPEFKPDILLIDSLSAISSAFSGEESRFRVYMEQLFRYLEAHHITSFLIREEAHPAHLRGSYAEKGEAISFLSDGIIVIYNVIFDDGRRSRALEILKMRGEDIDRRIVEVEIVNNKGFCVKGNLLKGKFSLT
jgi:circadian clock protein KaiC